MGDKHIEIAEYDKNLLEHLNKDIEQGNHVFVFLYMDNCFPCNETKPNWKKIKTNYKDMTVALVNKDLFSSLKNVGSEPIGFPTLRYIHKNKDGSVVVEEYEKSSFAGDKNRSTESFNKWIDHHISSKMKGGYKRRTQKRLMRKRKHATRKSRRSKKSQRGKR